MPINRNIVVDGRSFLINHISPYIWDDSNSYARIRSDDGETVVVSIGGELDRAARHRLVSALLQIDGFPASIPQIPTATYAGVYYPDRNGEGVSILSKYENRPAIYEYRILFNDGKTMWVVASDLRDIEGDLGSIVDLQEAS